MAGSPQNNSNIPYNYRSGIFSAAIVAKFVVSSFLQAKQNEKKKRSHTPTTSSWNLTTGMVSFPCNCMI